MKRRILLRVAFDGTNYAGWQLQPNGLTIEEVLNRELSRLLKEEIRVIGASRTDAGVHAEGAVCVFDTESGIPGDKFCYAINQSLPEDIRAMASNEVALDFHPRKRASIKTYRYQIYNDTFLPPSKRLYYHHVHGKLDIEAMQQAAGFFPGEHDFKAFSKEREDRAAREKRALSGETTEINTVRTIYRSQLSSDGPAIEYLISGSGFLYNMVRIIAGTLIDVGQGRIAWDSIPEILERRDRGRAGQTAPAKGLCLMNCDYNVAIKTEIKYNQDR